MFLKGCEILLCPEPNNRHTAKNPQWSADCPADTRPWPQTLSPG